MLFVKTLGLSVTGLFFLCYVAYGDSPHSKTSTNADNAMIHREVLTSRALSNIDGYKLTSVTVELQPGVTAPSHQHEAFIFVYVLQGRVISQLNNQAAVEYQVGEHWLELPGDIHSITQNPSKTVTAKFLAVFVAKDDARLTTSAELTKSDVNQ